MHTPIVLFVGLLFSTAGYTADSALPLGAGQESADPITTADPNVPVDDLRVMVKPLTRRELEVESEAWFALLRAKSRQIAVARLGVRKAGSAITAGNAPEAEAALEEVLEATRTAEESAELARETITAAAQERLGVEDARPDSQASVGEPAEAPAEALEIKEDLLEDINQLQDQRSALGARLELVLDSLERKGGDVTDYRSYAAEVLRTELETSDLDAAWSGVVGWLASEQGGKRWGGNLLQFVAVLVVAYFVGRLLAAFVTWLIERKLNLSLLAEKLISNTIRWVLLILGFAVALTALEVEATPVLAGVGALGVVAGLALQDSLSNVASGVLVLLNRPFDIGDVIDAGSTIGTVHQMNLVSTTLRTSDNQTIHVPNNEIWNNVITNITANETRRVDLEFGIGYEDDFEQAERIIREVVDAHELVLDDPEPVVVTHALSDSSVGIICRPWAKTGDWWRVKTDITREVKRRFDAAGISIPYPQQDVHIHYTEPSTRSGET